MTTITTEQFKSVTEVTGGKPAGSAAWMAYGSNPAFTGFGYSEAEAVADYHDRMSQFAGDAA